MVKQPLGLTTTKHSISVIIKVNTLCAIVVQDEFITNNLQYVLYMSDKKKTISDVHFDRSRFGSIAHF